MLLTVSTSALSADFPTAFPSPPSSATIDEPLALGTSAALASGVSFGVFPLRSSEYSRIVDVAYRNGWVLMGAGLERTARDLQAPQIPILGDMAVLRVANSVLESGFGAIELNDLVGDEIY